MTRTEGNYTEWQTSVNRIMRQTYGIDADDAGLDDIWLIDHWRAGELPKDFVAWFGQKYDLTSKRDAGIEGWI